MLSVTELTAFAVRFVVFFQPQRLEGTREPPSSSSSSFAAGFGDIDCNLQDFLAVDVFAAAASIPPASNSVDAFTNFEFLGGNVDAFSSFGTLAAVDEDTVTNSSSQGSSGDLESQLPFDLHHNNVTTTDLSVGQDIDLDSLFNLQNTHSLPLTEYAMGLPLFATPTNTISSASPMQESSSFSSSSSSNSPTSTRNPPSQLSTPLLNSPYRVQKQKAKPGPKPKRPTITAAAAITSAAVINSAFSSATPEDDPETPAVLDKRFRNNIAAKKYRQKKVDRISELEDALADMTRERDELRLLLARKEAEGQVLREVMAKSKSGREAR
ncbi:hypothetical protein ABW21_db0206296 [Orbilia brochopaga]|nr:hypothetical protein ABW21_db0206296 [Drechslerella brochopaga]